MSRKKKVNVLKGKVVSCNMVAGELNFRWLNVASRV